MAATATNRVNFVYVTGSELPASVDNDTVYFVAGSGKLYVGNVLIAEANQNAFGTITVGQSTFTAASQNAGIEFVAGSNVTLTPDTTNGTITIAATDTTYEAATQSTAGLMSAADKTKLDGVETGAQVNQDAFGTITVGSTDIAATTESDTFTITAGDNITLTPGTKGVTIAAADAAEYTLTKATTADTGFAATYQLFKDGTAVGDKINIPRDMVVSAGEVKVVTTADSPYQGAAVGDKYIDLTIANATSDHIYIPVNDLVDVYTAGNGINISNSNEISVDTTVIATRAYAESMALTWSVQ